MKKLTLDLTELDVQSFPTADGAAGREGTVHGMIFPTDQADCMNSGGFGIGFCEPGIWGNLGVNSPLGLPGIGVESDGDAGVDAFRGHDLNLPGGAA